MQSFKEIKNENTRSTLNEACELLDQANQCAVSALEKLAQIQGDAFEVESVRDLYPLFKVYALFSNLEEFEREMLIHLYQARTDLKDLRQDTAAAMQKYAFAEMEARVVTLRDRINAAGIPERLSQAQRTILETEFFHHAQTQSLTE